ncbi:MULTISPECIES: copper resistance D family protein [Amycolatopsis]|uniref:CopD family protein n=1 Tax=Amycolatopsis dongchuanensis TaxID=1070866 RepID=A0ABP9QAN5_9PSEU
MSKTETTSPTRYSTAVATVAAALAGVLVGVALTATGPVPGVTDAGAVVSVAIPVVRVLLDLAAVATVGLGLLSVLVGYDRPKLTEPVLALARPAAVASALVWATAAIVTLLLQTVEFRPRSKTVSFGDIAAYVGQIGAGKALLVVAGLALAHAGLGVLALRHGEKVPAEVRVGLALFALLPLPVTGHAANWNYHDYTMISMELHVMSAVAWTGGLGAMVVLLVGNRTLLAHALPRFSRLATLCLALTVVTGLFNAAVEILLNPTIGFFPALFTTAYGQLVLLKVVCAVAIGVLAANLRWRLMPRIVRHERTALASWASLELVVMGLAFGFAVVLTRAPVS